MIEGEQRYQVQSASNRVSSAVIVLLMTYTAAWAVPVSSTELVVVCC
jgi:hypothetical protein